MIRAMTEKRERLEALLFFGGNSLSIPLWWLSLWIWPSTRSIYFGEIYARNWRWDFALPDNLSALVGFAVCAFLFVRTEYRTAAAWLYTGMIGYAWGLSAAVALADPAAYLGFVIMTMVAAISLAFAIRFQKVNTLWGPFRFRKANPKNPSSVKMRSAVQISQMWSIFLVVIPSQVMFFERWMNWDSRWIHFPGQVFVGVFLFVVGGTIGLLANAAMNRHGGGTPLPSDCPNKLVVSGPYRFMRNPMAFGGILQGVAVGIGFGSPLVVVYALAGAVWWEILVRPLEEAYLESEFGAAYLEYVSRIRCWVPGLA